MGIGRAVSIVDPWRNIIYIINRSGDASLCSYKQDWRVVSYTSCGPIARDYDFIAESLSGKRFIGPYRSIIERVSNRCWASTRENKWTTLRRE